jgi:rubrerythrin
MAIEISGPKSSGRRVDPRSSPAENQGSNSPRAARSPMNLRCSDCGYGAVARTLPPLCPMCRGSSWEFAEWRPFSRARTDD